MRSGPVHCGRVVVVRRLLAAGLVGLAWVPPAWPFGFTAHRKITAAAIERLPEPLAGFFRANARTIVEHSIDPDLWRAAGNTSEGPNHYINIDALAPYPFDDVPQEESEFRRRFGEEGRRAGRLPFRIGEMSVSLSEAFLSRDGEAIRREAAVLAHYVEDLHVPLHLTRNHDGQETGQRGIHRRWESQLVDHFVEQLPWAGAGDPVTPAGDPITFAFRRLREGYPAVDRILASDREAVGGAVDYFETPFDDRYDAAYFSRWFLVERERLVATTGAAAEALARIWLEAWHRAGRPALPLGVKDRFVRGENRAVVMTWDGAAEFLVERLLSEGKLPNLARLASRGTSFDYALSTFPTKTAPAHAAIYTGATGEVNGITGNRVLHDPGEGSTALDSHSGYASTSLRAEPLWVTAARQGLRSVVLHATQVYPFDPYLEQARFGADFGRDLLFFFGYEEPKELDRVYRRRDVSARTASGWRNLPAHLGQPLEFELEVWGETIHAVLVDTRGDPRAGYDRMILGPDRTTTSQRRELAALPPRAPEGHFLESIRLRREGREGAVYFRLFELSPDGSDFLLYQSKVYSERVSRAELEGPLLHAVGGFQGNDPSHLYEAGALGPTLMQGGEGRAEERYLDLVEMIFRQFERETELALGRTDWDLLVHYLPFPDDTQHLWYGYIDARLPGHDPILGKRLLGFLEEVYRLDDRLLGIILDRAPSNTIFVLASDHGVAGANRVAQPNVALARAGLLSASADGGIDLARTRTFYHPADFGALLLNRDAYRSGTVPPEDEGEVLAAAERALRQVRDEETGKPIYTSFRSALQDTEGLGLGGVWGGDLYLDLAYGYDFAPGMDGHGDVLPVPPRGTHVFSPSRVDMHAILYLGGPGVARGRRAGAARLIDIAPTLAVLLGIEPPRNARGRTLTEAIEPEP